MAEDFMKRSSTPQKRKFNSKVPLPVKRQKMEHHSHEQQSEQSQPWNVESEPSTLDPASEEREKDEEMTHIDDRPIFFSLAGYSPTSNNVYTPVVAERVYQQDQTEDTPMEDDVPAPPESTNTPAPEPCRMPPADTEDSFLKNGIGMPSPAGRSSPSPKFRRGSGATIKTPRPVLNHYKAPADPLHYAHLPRNGQKYSFANNDWAFNITIASHYEIVGDATNVTAESMRYLQPGSTNISLQFLLEEKVNAHDLPPAPTHDLSFTVSKIPGNRALSAINLFLHHSLPLTPSQKSLRTFVLSFSTNPSAPNSIAPPPA
ncbi:hypothetical protein CC86DRAFT_400506 [Ophiobolus disseminans]|uniref:Uncharacterized protein n=1 Tax=Ophiobolus disseminans TaxID=1469910 RepID=A0A6A7AKW4_9PLEO|nr:hypothetical protein CC86DRAFT_400506 [Ophiobolus disseminans]